MTNNKIIKAIKLINPNAGVTVGGHSLDEITWLNETTPIPKADIEAKMAELPTEKKKLLKKKQKKHLVNKNLKI